MGQIGQMLLGFGLSILIMFFGWVALELNNLKAQNTLLEYKVDQLPVALQNLSERIEKINE